MRTDLLALGVFGAPSRLRERIETLLARKTANSSRGRFSVSFLAAALLVAVLAASLTPRWIAFAQENRPSFEVASIKPNDSGRSGFDGFKLSHGGFRAMNVSLQMLIEAAYRLPYARISGGPNWIASARFDIAAKGDEGATNSQIWRMVQSLLADRFRLGVHREIKNLPTYELVAAKGGPKLRKARDGICNSGPLAAGSRIDLMQSVACDETASVYGPEGYLLWGKSVSASALADALSDIADRPVTDRTGLNGLFEITLQWKPDGYIFTRNENERGETRSPVAEAPNSIYAALQEQLGLKLESAKGPVEILVIDHAEKPDAN
jgi:uncharacterized protein (TIGR03435 family)